MDLLLRIDRHLAPVLAGLHGSAQAAAPRIVGAFCEALGWVCGTFWTRDLAEADRLVCMGAWGVDTPGVAEYLQYTQSRRPILNSAGIVGSAWLKATPVWVTDVTEDETFRRLPIARRAGLRAALAFPVAVGTQVLGVIELYSTAEVPRDEGLLQGLPLLAGQVAQYLLRAQVQAQVNDSEKRFRSLAALSSDWYWELDAQHRFVRFEGHGAGPGTELAPVMIGRPLWDVQGLVAGLDWAEQRACMERHEPFRDVEVVYRDDAGELVHMSLHGDPGVDVQGQFTGYRGVARDLTLQKQATQRLQYMATHDDITGLPNRVALRQLVSQAVELAKRYERCFAVMVLNIDRFQRMNDGLGRDIGDALLRELGQRVKKQLRASDVVARLDGDEFAVLAHELQTPQHAAPIARKLLDAIGEPLSIQGQEFRLSACVGVAAYPHDANDERTLMKQAGLALRAAKREGVGQVRFSEAVAGGKPRTGAVAV